MKPCTRCLINKDLSEFLIRRDTGKPTSHCRVCRNAAGRINYTNPKVKEQFRNRALKYEFGITLEDYNQMLIQQDGCCFTCKRHENVLSKRLVVDHNHSTGAVRGLLCDYCNRLLGNYENKPELFNAFDDYLRKCA